MLQKTVIHTERKYIIDLYTLKYIKITENKTVFKNAQKGDR